MGVNPLDIAGDPEAQLLVVAFASCVVTACCTVTLVCAVVRARCPRWAGLERGRHARFSAAAVVPMESPHPRVSTPWGEEAEAGAKGRRDGTLAVGGSSAGAAQMAISEEVSPGAIAAGSPRRVSAATNFGRPASGALHLDTVGEGSAADEVRTAPPSTRHAGGDRGAGRSQDSDSDSSEWPPAKRPSPGSRLASIARGVSAKRLVQPLSRRSGTHRYRGSGATSEESQPLRRATSGAMSDESDESDAGAAPASLLGADRKRRSVWGAVSEEGAVVSGGAVSPLEPEGKASPGPERSGGGGGATAAGARNENVAGSGHVGVGVGGGDAAAATAAPAAARRPPPSPQEAGRRHVGPGEPGSGMRPAATMGPGSLLLRGERPLGELPTPPAAAGDAAGSLGEFHSGGVWRPPARAVSGAAGQGRLQPLASRPGTSRLATRSAVQVTRPLFAMKPLPPPRRALHRALSGGVRLDGEDDSPAS